MQPVIPCLEIFVPLVGGNDDIDGMSTFRNIEGPLAGFNTGNGLGLGQLPSRAPVDSADMTNSFVWVLSMSLIDTLYSMRCCHNYPRPRCCRTTSDRSKVVLPLDARHRMGRNRREGRHHLARPVGRRMRGRPTPRKGSRL